MNESEREIRISVAGYFRELFDEFWSENLGMLESERRRLSENVDNVLYELYSADSNVSVESMKIFDDMRTSNETMNTHLFSEDKITDYFCNTWMPDFNEDTFKITQYKNGKSVDMFCTIKFPKAYEGENKNIVNSLKGKELTKETIVGSVRSGYKNQEGFINYYTVPQKSTDKIIGRLGATGNKLSDSRNSFIKNSIVSFMTIYNDKVIPGICSKVYA